MKTTPAQEVDAARPEPPCGTAPLTAVPWASHPLVARWARTGPKRILSIDGGGVRGIVALAFLERIERSVQNKHGVAHLAEYFDLIAGTSTGSIIAAQLALGKSVREIRELYLTFCQKAFTSNPLGAFSGGLLTSKFRLRPLTRLAQEVFGDIRLGDPSIRTGILLMLHRADSNSPWPVHNHPDGKFYRDSTDAAYLANRHLPLANLVLASCAAPSYFRPQRIEIGRLPDGRAIQGTFVDGSVSPHKNPALQALRVATAAGYGFQWPLGEDQLMIVSVGTGMRRRLRLHRSWRPSGMLAVESLFALLETCNDEVELMLQWMSNSPTARLIDSEVGDLTGRCVTGRPAFQYWRWNLPLEREWLAKELLYEADEGKLDRLYRLDGVNNLAELHDLATRCAARTMPADFG